MRCVQGWKSGVAAFLKGAAAWSVALAALAVPANTHAAEMSYQGELLRNGTPFNGTAQMKFVLCKNGVTVWSNDLTSTGCSQPTAAVNVTVTNGIFAVILGGPGMQTISGPGAADLGGAVLRVWANTGGTFENLPDQPLASAPTAMGVVQVDPAATNFMARWDGNALSRSTVLAEVNGRVGIGTTSPVAALDVQGRMRLTDASNSLGVIRRPDNQGSIVELTNGGFAHFGNVEFRNTVGQLNGVFTIDGRLGLGDPAPSELLTVAGNIRTGGLVFPDGVPIHSRSELIGDRGPQGIQGIQGIQGVPGHDGTNGLDGASPFTLVGNDAVFPSGYVGIGVSASPPTPLWVQGPGNGGVGAGFDQPSGVGFVDFHTHNGGGNVGTVLRFIDNNTFSADIASIADGALVFSTAQQHRLVLNNAGNVGIGTDTPASKLTVAGVVQATGGILFGDGSSMTTTTAGGSLQGSFPNLTLRPGTIGTIHYADGSISTAKLQNSSVDTTKLALLSVNNAILASNSVSGLKIVDGAVTDSKIANVAWSKVTGAPNFIQSGQIAGGSLSGTYPNPGIAPASVGNLQLASDRASLARVSGGDVFDSGGNIGIGVALPSEKLVVAGVIQSTLGGIKFPDGSVQSTAATSAGVCLFNGRTYTEGARCALGGCPSCSTPGQAQCTIQTCQANGSWSAPSQSGCSTTVYPQCGQ